MTAQKIRASKKTHSSIYSTYVHTFLQQSMYGILDGGHLELLDEEDITINLRNLYSVDDKDFSDRQVCIFLKGRKKSSKGRQQDDMSGMQRDKSFAKILSKQKYSIYVHTYLLTIYLSFLDIYLFSRIMIQNKLYTLCLHYCHILFISNISQS